MKYKVLSLLGLLFILSFTQVSATSPEPPQFLQPFEYKKEITLPALEEATYVKVVLDREVASSDTNYQDVRIFTERLEEVPYQLVVERARAEEGFYSSEVLNQVSDGEGRLMFVLDLGQDGLIHNRLNLRASNENYRRNVSVYTSETLLDHNSLDWLLASDDQYIFRYTDRQADFSAERGVVNYPRSTARYIRVVVEEGPEGALSLGRASVYRHEVSEAERERLEAEAVISENQEFRSTDLLIDLQNPGTPLSELTLFAPAENNFNRNVVVSGSNDLQNWRSLTRSRIFKVNTPEFQGESMSVNFPESTYRYYRVSVINEDDRPLNFENRVSFSGDLRSVVFQADPNESYYLYYGNPETRAPRYDLARIFQYLEAQDFPVASLSAAEINPDHSPSPEPVVPFTERFPYMINAVVVVLVIFIGFLIFLYARKLKNTDTGEDSNLPTENS